MTIKQHGGIFGRNPTFNNVTVDGTLAINGPITIGGDVFSGLDYDGTWNASTNTPTLTSSVGTIGHFYIVSVAGSTDLDGITNWGIGDWAVFNGSVWQRVEGGADGNFAELSVTGTSQFADGLAASPSITNIGDTNTGLYFPSADAIAIVTGGVNRLRVTSAGDIGIGTTSPGAKLSVDGDAIFNDSGADVDFRVEGDTDANLLFLDASADTAFIGTTTNTNSSKLVVNGTISETVSSTQYLIASQYDVGTAPNELPLVQYLGTAAFASIPSVALISGGSIQAGTGTICKTSLFNNDGVKQITSIMDLTGLYSPASGDIIGKDASTLPAYIFQIPAGMTVLGGRMTCLETPAGGEDDIDLYSATEGTGVEDTAISTLTETQIINAGAQTAGTVTYFAADPAASSYLYLVSADATAGTYTAGRFLIEIFGV